MKKIVLLAFLSVLLSLVAVVSDLPTLVVAHPAEIVVPDDYAGIQDALNNANDGDTIYVRADTYYEHLVVNKSVSLIGEDKETTIIDGNKRGTVVVVTASGVLISNFTIRNSKYTAWYSGVKVEMDNCTITNNIITNNWFGVYLGYYPGQHPKHSFNNSISGNSIENNRVGVYLSGCANSTITGNNITKSSTGVFILSGSDNQIYHNNFIENFFQVAVPEVMSAIKFSILQSVWDDLFCVSYPSGGNYWSDYFGNDTYSGPYQDETGSDGIGDTAYTIYAMLPDNYPYPTLVIIDSYPLIGPISFFDAGTWNKMSCDVNVISNSTVSNFQLNETTKVLSFNVTGETGLGFCRVAIPNSIVQDLWQGNWTVLVDGEPPLDIRNWTDTENTYIYFTYFHSEHEVMIVPEFPTGTSLLLILIILTVATAIYKRRLLKTPIH